MKAIAGTSIDAWLRRLAEDSEVLVPQRRPGGDVVLGALDDAPRTDDYVRLAESPKRILMPQTDDLVRFEGPRGRAALDETRRILFGLRPCDAAAITVMDEFFRRDYADPNYLARRERMRLIVTACSESEETCFCASAGTGPVAGDGFDVQLFGVGDIYLVESGTEAGEQMIERGGELFGDPPADAERLVQDFRRRAEASQQTRLDLERVRRIIRSGAEPEGFWERVADRCLMCGGCAYVCPTCTCYNIVDRPVSEAGGVRQRLWDTCVLGGFTREASGHNPRGRQSLRCAHRYLHKLGGSDSPDRRFRCVGCGRCADACIADVGIINIVTELLSEARDGSA